MNEAKNVSADVVAFHLITLGIVLITVGYMSYNVVMFANTIVSSIK